MSHLVHVVKHLDAKRCDHQGKVGGWVKGGRLVYHKPGFFKDHLAGTFHHAQDSVLSLPSDHIAVLRILP